MTEKKTLLLVGGKLCKRTVKLLNKDEWNFIGLRRRRMEPRQGGIRWYQADLRSQESLDSLFEGGTLPKITHILYAASPDGRTQSQYADVYAFGLPRLLSSLHKAGRAQDLQRCVLVTSTAVWGPSEDWIDEDTPPEGSGFRAQSLLQAEEALQGFLEPGQGVALRLSGLYGTGHVRRLAADLQAGKVTVPDGPGHWANRIHVQDAARACAHLLLLAQPEPLYIGTDNQPTPKAELYDALAKAAGAPLPERQSQDPTGKRLSNTRLRATGWHPLWPDMVQGYLHCFLEMGSDTI